MVDVSKRKLQSLLCNRRTGQDNDDQPVYYGSSCKSKSSVVPSLRSKMAYHCRKKCHGVEIKGMVVVDRLRGSTSLLCL